MTITLQASDSVEYFHDTDYELLGNIANYNVVSGCGLTDSGSNMEVTIAAGVVTHNGSSVTVAGGTLTLIADGSNKRWSYATVDSGGSGVLVSGDAAASSSVEPTKPELGDRVPLKMYKIEAGQTIASSIAVALDKRLIAPTSNPFDGIRTQFRANRRLVAEYTAAKPDSRVSSTAAAVLLYAPAGVGFYAAYVASDTIAAVSGEPVASFGSGAIVTRGGIGSFGPTSDGDHSLIAVLAPSASPRMLCRVDLPAASANLTVWLAGFFAANAGATDNGAYLRIATTGNTFFVTRQGGTETATDLGALSRTTVLGFEIETADAGVTWVCRNQAGTALATHTTNVPTAATALAYGIVATTATGAIPHGVASCRIEGTFA